MNDIRFVAEWSRPCVVMVALPEPETDWEYMLEAARGCYAGMIRAMVEAGQPVMVLCRHLEEAQRLLAGLNERLVTLVQLQYNDTWTRDYGPLTVVRQERWRALNFGFNGWGLKFAANKDNLVNLALQAGGVWRQGAYRNESDFVLEGGSVESDGLGNILTTTRCLCSPNRNGGKSKEEIAGELSRRLGAEHLLWLDHGALLGDDTDSHIDTLARLCPDNVIVYTGCFNPADPQYAELEAMKHQLENFRTAEGDPFHLIELPLPDAILDPDDGHRLPATYTNYLVTPTHLFVPAYGQADNDRLAQQMLQAVFPDHEVVAVDCRALIRQHGSLHCATMQLPLEILDLDKLGIG